MEIRNFDAAMASHAAALLAGRHQTERALFPGLPARFEKPEHAEKAIRGLSAKSPSVGVAAFRHEKMVGYMIAQTLNEPQRGRHAWIDYAGYALDPNEPEELIRQLYCELGEQLVQLGYFSHFVLTPCGNPKAMDAWFRVCFAYEQVHGLLDLKNVQPLAPYDSSIRLAVKSDEAAVREMSNMIPSQVASAPSWGATLPEMLPDLNDGYAELLDEEDVRFWAAFEEDGTIAGCIAAWPDEASEADMRIPERCSTVSCVATREGFRGKGLSSQLLSIVLNEAKQSGFEFFETDWRMANLPISNFLPRRGFKPYAYRLHRQIDARVLWANGSNSTK
ncbi:GNAT family N-acetyltransferase [Planococcus sp. 107-1]|uniref:GNAT family N-acetyltransferase n=1 Tax=Planococcus sp. 107-1 TaxID=2908840 RepID=UPI001F1B5149|nr:GNAT family N-acetyltransferase [Planococcus sp. 107-1]UJF26894.1 GNAT family N-acetyltransferase [Planococcus sp. 107-1]